MGSGSTNGWTMNELVAIGSMPTPHKVYAMLAIESIGCVSAHTCADAPFPISVAAPPTALARIRSRLVNRVSAIWYPARVFFAPDARFARMPIETGDGGPCCTARAVRNHVISLGSRRG